MNIGKFFAALFGLLFILVGAALIAGVVAIFTADQDDDDFFVSDVSALETTSFAITGDMDILDEAPARFVDWFTDVVDVRMTAISSVDGDLFIGVADTADVDGYLADVAYDEVTRLDLNPFEVDYRSHEGAAEPAAPGTQTFWVASVEGSGQQTLDWAVESGTWSVVVMDADAGRGVSADTVFGGKVENIVIFMWIAFGLGLVLGLTGLAMLWVGIRNPRGPQAPPLAAPPAPDQPGQPTGT